MEKLLTIVVPAYNVEKYIKNCLDSFIDLSVLRSLEILIVDDGSTDSTASLAHTYEQKYPYSFKMLSKENGRPWIYHQLCDTARNRKVFQGGGW